VPEDLPRLTNRFTASRSAKAARSALAAHEYAEVMKTRRRHVGCPLQ
jgi:hypothetical protein